jgi:carboxymethylenebutenolidase
MPEAIKVIMPLFQNFSVESAVNDAEFFLDYLSEQKHVRAGKVGATGYCLGGGLSIRTAARHPNRIAAAASFHAGNLATDAHDSPHLLLNKIKAELYIAHADNDQSMPAAQIERLNTALKESHVRYKAEVYKDAAHGFTMADLPAYNKAALALHWKNLSELFNRTLTNPGH